MRSDIYRKIREERRTLGECIILLMKQVSEQFRQEDGVSKRGIKEVGRMTYPGGEKM